VMIKNSPQTFEGYWARARLLLAAHRDEEAIQWLQAALQHAPGPASPISRQLTSVLEQAKKAQTSPSR